MAWVRWSTVCENGRESALYMYDDVGGGVTVHVAGRRRVGQACCQEEGAA